MAKIEKKCMVDEYTREIESSAGIFLFRFSKFSAQNADNLRRVLPELGSRYRVIKNRLFRLAIRDTKLEQLQEKIDGPTAMAFVPEDPAEVARKIYEFCKEHEGLEIIAGWFAGRLLSASDIQEIATLPPRPVLLAKVVGGISSPLGNLVNVLKGNLATLVCILKSIKDKKS